MKKLFLGIAVLLALSLMASVVVAGVGNSIPKGLKKTKTKLLAIAKVVHCLSRSGESVR
jgi:hypothetical protein